MILTPLQLVCLIALILIVCGTVTWLVTMHQRERFDDRIDSMYHHFALLNQRRRVEIDALRKDSASSQTITIHPDGTPSEDALTAWEQIINTERKRSNRT